MFDHMSRYLELENLHYLRDRDREVVYKSRRFLPRHDRRFLFEVDIAQSDRPDLIAARTLQSSDLFWRLCDANRIMHPFDLTDRSGARIGVPMPGA